MWDLPGPGLEPVSPALAGGFLTTVPPGKSLTIFLEQMLFGFYTTQFHPVCLDLGGLLISHSGMAPAKTDSLPGPVYTRLRRSYGSFGIRRWETEV